MQKKKTILLASLAVMAALTLLQKTQKEIKAEVVQFRKEEIKISKSNESTTPRRNQPIKLDPALLLGLPLEKAGEDLQSLLTILDNTRFYPSELRDKSMNILDKASYPVLEDQTDQSLAAMIKTEQRVIETKTMFIELLLEYSTIESFKKGNKDIELRFSNFFSIIFS